MTDAGARRGVPRVRPYPLMQVLWHLHRFAYRVSGGRIGPESSGDRGTLALRTIGRNSGAMRETLLTYFRSSGAYVVVASNAGHDRYPAWYLNLRAHPEVQVRVGDRWLPARARITSGRERDDLWARVVERDAQYAAYARGTDRPIPVVALEPPE